MTGAIAVFLAFAWQGNADSALAVYRRQMAMDRGAWERGRACVVDTLRLYRQAGRDPETVARTYAEQSSRDTSMRHLTHDACLAALTGGPTRFVPPPVPAEAAAALKPKRRPPFSSGAFGPFTWVFYADLALGTILGAVVALFQTRTVTKGWRIALTVMGGAVGGLIGGAVFLPFMFLSALFMFLNPPEPPLLFGMTALVIVVAAGGAVAGLLSRKRRGSTMADYKRSLGLKDR